MRLSIFALPLLTACGASALDASSDALRALCPEGSSEAAGGCLTEIPDFVVECSSEGQVCDNAFTTDVQTTGELAVNYVVRASHCSSIRVTFSVDGAPVFTSDTLGFGEYAETGFVPLGPVEPGVHAIAVTAEGVEDGCNAGQLGSWGGALQIETSAELAPTEEIVDQTIDDFVVECTSEGQLCDTPFTTEISTESVLEVNYVARASHCSSIAVSFAVDGAIVYTSPVLGFGEYAETGAIVLGPVAPGAHTVSVYAEGQADGCNAGQLQSWGGALQLRTSELR